MFYKGLPNFKIQQFLNFNKYKDGKSHMFIRLGICMGPGLARVYFFSAESNQARSSFFPEGSDPRLTFFCRHGPGQASFFSGRAGSGLYSPRAGLAFYLFFKNNSNVVYLLIKSLEI